MKKILYHFQDPRPTIVPAKKWDRVCGKYVEKLDKAMDGIGTDEQAIIEVICGCNSKQRSELKSEFKGKYLCK